MLSEEQRKARLAGPSSHKVKFTKDEDLKLLLLVKEHGGNDWKVIAQFLPPRTPRQCRERWTNYVNPSLSQDPWSKEEDMLLVEKHKEFGNHWKIIEKYFPARSKNSIKHRWTTVKCSYLPQLSTSSSSPSSSPSPSPSPSPVPSTTFSTAPKHHLQNQKHVHAAQINQQQQHNLLKKTSTNKNMLLTPIIKTGNGNDIISDVIANAAAGFQRQQQLQIQQQQQQQQQMAIFEIADIMVNETPFDAIIEQVLSFPEDLLTVEADIWSFPDDLSF